MAAGALAPEERSRVEGVVRATALVSAAMLAAYALGLGPRTALDGRTLLVAGFLATCALALHQADFALPWGRARLSSDLDEAAVFLSLALLPPLLLPAIILPGTILRQVTKRRPFLKGVFNTASRGASAVVAGGAYLVVAPFDPLVGAAIATAFYSLTSQVFVAPILVRLSTATYGQVVRDRLVPAMTVQVVLGVAGGIIGLALWNMHPLALAAVVPFFVVAHMYGRYQERAESVLVVHRRLEALAASFAKPESLDAVAQEALKAVLDLVGPADASITVDSRTWRKSSGHSWGSARTQVVPLVGPSGRLHGTLRVDAPDDRSRPMGPATIRLVAEQTAGAIERVGA